MATVIMGTPVPLPLDAGGPAAIQRLQADHGLEVDGVLGPSARAALDHRFNQTRYSTATGPTG